MLAGLITSCSDKEESLISTQEEAAYFSTSLSISTNEFKTRTEVADTEETPICDWVDLATAAAFDASAYEAEITIVYHKGSTSESQPDVFKVPIKNIKLDDDGDPVAVTDQFTLIKPLTKHELVGIKIVDNQDNVIFSTVKEGALYANHIREAHLMPLSIYVGIDDTAEEGTVERKVIIDDKEKTPIKTSVLCAFEEEAPNFGYSLWTFNFVRVVCIPYSVNVKKEPCESNSKDVYGKTKITLSRVDGSDTYVHESSTLFDEEREEVMGKICFNYQGDQDYKEQEWTLKLEIFFLSGATAVIESTISLEDLWNYKESGYWVYPKGTILNKEDNNYDPKGYIHFDFFNVDLTKAGAISNPEADGTWELEITKAINCCDDIIACEDVEVDTSSIQEFYAAIKDLTGECAWTGGTVEDGALYINAGQKITSPVFELEEGQIINALVEKYGTEIATQEEYFKLYDACTDALIINEKGDEVTRSLSGLQVYSIKANYKGKFYVTLEASEQNDGKASIVNFTFKKALEEIK